MVRLESEMVRSENEAVGFQNEAVNPAGTLVDLTHEYTVTEA